MTNRSKILPGMIDNSVEFFVVNDELKMIQKGKVLSFHEFSYSIITMLEEQIKREPAAGYALKQMHPGSGLKRVEQFAKCRFGGLDYHPDISQNTVQEGEYWNCPKRGSCPHEGILCKMPVHNGYRLNQLDISIIINTSTDKTNEVIAMDLNVPLGTFHKHKKTLYDRLGVQTKQEIAILAMVLNLI